MLERRQRRALREHPAAEAGARVLAPGEPRRSATPRPPAGPRTGFPRSRSAVIASVPNCTVTFADEAVISNTRAVILSNPRRHRWKPAIMSSEWSADAALATSANPGQAAQRQEPGDASAGWSPHPLCRFAGAGTGPSRRQAPAFAGRGEFFATDLGPAPVWSRSSCSLYAHRGTCQGEGEHGCRWSA